jgi:hypothetical protein
MVNEFSERQKAFIAGQGVLRFNSLTPDGQIHCAPLCFAFDGRNFYVHCGNTGAKRWRNLRKNNVVSLELDSYTDDWSGWKVTSNTASRSGAGTFIVARGDPVEVTVVCRMVSKVWFLQNRLPCVLYTILRTACVNIVT